MLRHTAVKAFKTLTHGAIFLATCNAILRFKRCKFVKNVWYVKNILANSDGNMYFPILHLPRVELRCKLQEKLHRVTGPLLIILKVLSNGSNVMFTANVL